MAINDNKDRLQKLRGSDYEIVDGEPDIRGWDVKDSNGSQLGKIDDLIFDTGARKVRYMIVDLDKSVSRERRDDVLIPIGLAELHQTAHDAFLPGVTAEQLASLPRYDGDTISSDTENKIRSVFAGLGLGAAGAAITGDTGEDFYNHEHFNEDNFRKNRKGDAAEGTRAIPVIEENLQIGKQTVQTGGAYIRSRIVEKPVEETLNLKEERVTIERTPVDRPVGSADLNDFKEGEIELKEYAEVPVVSKEARVVEEITVGKEVEEREEIIHDTVRKTEVDIEEIPGSKKSSDASSGRKDE